RWSRPARCWTWSAVSKDSAPPPGLCADLRREDDQVITAAAVCPHPPLLLRELTGQHDAAAELRAACRTAVDRVLHGAEHVALIGGAPAVPGTTRPDLAGGLPWSLRVGLRLLDDAQWTGPVELHPVADTTPTEDRKSTRLNSSHVKI